MRLTNDCLAGGLDRKRFNFQVKGDGMNNASILLRSIFELEGVKGVALADYRSGESLNLESRMSGNLDFAVAADSGIIRAKINYIHQFGILDAVEEIVISLVNEYHLIKLLKRYEGLFLYLVLDRTRSNLALTKLKLLEIDDKLVLDVPVLAVSG